LSHRSHSYFKKKLTFMVVPNDGGRPLQIKTNLFMVHLLILGVGIVLGWAAYVISKDVNYQLAAIQARNFKANMQEILAEMETNREMINRMAQLDSQFRKLLKLGGRKQILSYSGVGGPTEEDSARFDAILQKKNDDLMNKVNTTLKDDNQKASLQEASFKEISTFLDKQRSILAATPSIWPVKGWITSGYGKRASPLTGEPGYHYGVDIANEVGSPIRVTADGIVTYSGWETGYGRVVVVEHGYGYSTRYGHCSRIDVTVGQSVRRGDVLAYMGSTGRSTGSHCHYEVRIHGVPVDPEKYLPNLE
jgi:murein DD-endopeptidase MepM/ murein hydrolase activator NlpD